MVIPFKVSSSEIWFLLDSEINFTSSSISTWAISWGVNYSINLEEVLPKISLKGLLDLSA
ncbi:MAG: hypothetical protein WBH76_03815 [Dictyoglomaceae bacterium]|nr:hypothetical protein [Candidatus Atribacteria bacterium]